VHVQRIFIALFVLSSATGWAAPYLFTSFRGNGEDGLHLALSTNGYTWTALKYYLFFKDERKDPLKKNLRYAQADRPSQLSSRAIHPIVAEAARR
jgi:hypothetical protein